MKAASVFPRTISNSVTGSVRRVSIEPLFFSYEKSRIVNAGIKNERTIGSKEKRFLKLALF